MKSFSFFLVGSSLVLSGIVGLAAASSSEPEPRPDVTVVQLAQSAEIQEMIKLKLMVKYSEQLKLAADLDARLPEDKRGHVEAVLYVITIEFQETLDALDKLDEEEPIVIPENLPIS